MRSKSRLIAVVASMLVCVAMVGTGFASWVILASTDANATGNIKTETVTDDTIKNFTATLSKQDIVYGGETGSNTAEGKWLINDAQAANLETVVTLKMDGTLGALSAVFSATENWDTAVANGYITAPKLSIETGTESYITISDGSGQKEDRTPDEYKYDFTVVEGKQTLTTATELKVKVTFGWGALFNSQSPYVFFNDADRKANDKLGEYYTTNHGAIDKAGLSSAPSTETTWKDYAKGLLEKLNELIGTAEFKFVFTATPTTPAD